MATVTEFENPDLPASTGRSQGVARTGAKKSSQKNRKNAAEPRMGRPHVEVDWSQVEKMANLFTPIPDIAYILGVSIDTLERGCKNKFDTTLAVWWKAKAAHGKLSLRRALFTEAVGYENKGALRDRNGDYLVNEDGDVQVDPKRDRRPNMQALLYLAKFVLDLEGVAPVYDPEHDPDAEDERDGSQTVYPIQFVGTDADEVNETPAPGEDALSDDDDTEGHLDATGLKPYDPNAPQPHANDE